MYRIRSNDYTDTSITMRNVKGNVRARAKRDYRVDRKEEDGNYYDLGYSFKTWKDAQAHIARRSKL